VILWLLACKHGDWHDETSVDRVWYLDVEQRESAFVWDVAADVDVDRMTVTDPDDDGLDDATTLEVKQTVEATFIGSGTLRVMHWGATVDELVPPPTTVPITADPWTWSSGWDRCAIPCALRHELRFELLDSDQAQVDATLEVKARASDDDNPILGGSLDVVDQ
jgi:hypothetical protein